MRKATNLRSPVSLPSSDAAREGGTNGAVDGASEAALARGYTRVQDDPPGFTRSAYPGEQKEKPFARPWLGNPIVTDDEERNG